MQRHFIDISTQLESWYQTESGQYLLNTETELVNRQIDRFFGHHLVQIGISSRYPLYQSSPINHKLTIGVTAGSELITDLSELPFDSDSLDIIILHHSLEFYNKHHHLLREAQRCIAAQGRLIIVGFNPLSLLGVLAQTLGRLPRSRWKQKTISRKRLGDWLALLGFDIRAVHYGYSLPPLQSDYLRGKMSAVDQYMTSKNLPLGGVFVITASKQLSTLTPIRPRWNRVRAPLIGLTASRTATANLPRSKEVGV
jgi:SAM-dependent methyltransferase